MSQKFLTSIDLNRNEIQNVVIHKVAVFPSTGLTAGLMVYNTAAEYDSLFIYNGSQWVDALSPSLGVTDGVFNLDITNDTLTISPFTSSTAGKFDDSATTPTSTANALNFNGVFRASQMWAGSLTLNADPSASMQAATKQYVDNMAQGLVAKEPVVVATTANITLSGTQTIDGVALNVSDRVLVKNQTNAAENGCYVVASGAWPRSTDTDTWSELPGAFFFVSSGDTQGSNGYICTVQQGGTLDTDDVTFQQFSGAGQITAGGGLTKTGNQLDVVGTTNRITVNADNIDISTDYVGQSSINTLGTITTGVWHGTALEVAYGGTGITSFTAGDIIYASGATTLAKLAKGTANQIIGMNSGATAPEYKTVSGANGLSITNGANSLQVTHSTTDGYLHVPATSTTNDGKFLKAGATAGSISWASIVWSDIGSKPTTLSGYGITDAQPVDGDLTAIAALSGTGFAKRTGADTWSLDTTVARKYSVAIGDGASTSIVVTHNLGTRDVSVSIRETAGSYNFVFTDIAATTTNTITLTFAVAPNSGEYTVTVIG